MFLGQPIFLDIEHKSSQTLLHTIGNYFEILTLQIVFMKLVFMVYFSHNLFDDYNDFNAIELKILISTKCCRHVTSLKLRKSYYYTYLI